MRGIDPGTLELLRASPAPPARGHLLDLGCGYGPIACTLAHRAPEAVVWAVDVNDRALDLTARNAAALGLPAVRAVRPDGVPASVRFAGVWSNPPIRIGKAALHELLGTWLARLEHRRAIRAAWTVTSPRSRHLRMTSGSSELTNSKNRTDSATRSPAGVSAPRMATPSRSTPVHRAMR